MNVATGLGTAFVDSIPLITGSIMSKKFAAGPANIVMDQFRRGWLLGGRLLRPAQVIVSSGAPDPVIADNEPSNVTD